MKTEKEFSEYFLEVFKTHGQVQVVDAEGLKEISKSYWTDLTSHLSSYFSHEDRLQITEKAALLLAESANSISLSESWKNVLRDFNQNNYWNFEQISRKPKPIQTEEQKIFWKLFKYAWAFFQSMIILKIAVYYYGLESASHPDQVSSFWVWLFFGLSTSSLIFFAYRNRHDKN